MSPLLEELKIQKSNKPLGETIKVRVDSELRRDLDRIEVYAKGKGYLGFSRSDLIRAAIVSFVEGVHESLPEVSEIHLPEEREMS